MIRPQRRDPDDFTNPDYFYVPITREVAGELLSRYGREWWGTNLFDAWYEILKDRTEMHDRHHAPHLFYPQTIQDVWDELAQEEQEF